MEKAIKLWLQINVGSEFSTRQQFEICEPKVCHVLGKNIDGQNQPKINMEEQDNKTCLRHAPGAIPKVMIF